MIHFVLIEVELRAVVGKDGTWCPIVSREVRLIFGDPTFLDFVEYSGICAVAGVLLEEDGHSQHIAPSCRVTIFSTSVTGALISGARGAGWCRAAGRVRL